MATSSPLSHERRYLRNRHDRYTHGGYPAMATSIEEIIKGLVELPLHQRLALVRLLLDLDCSGTDDEIDVAWDEEIRARVEAVDEGCVAGIGHEQIKKEMAERFPPR